MLWPGIKKIGKELNFKRTDSEVSGMFENCFVKMYDGKNIKVLEIYAPKMDDDDKNAIIKKMEANKIKKYEWSANSIKIIFQEMALPYPVKKIKILMEDITGYFNSRYPCEKPQCQHCGEQDGTDIFSINNVSMLTCNNCYRQTERNIQSENTEQINKESNYLFGFFGAILFSIPGILIAILFFVYLDTLAAVSAVIYILLGIIGYKKFKGKMSPKGAIVVICAGLIMVGIGTTIAYSANILVLLYRETSEINFDLLFYILKMPEIQGELKTNLIISYFVSCIYFILQLNTMLKEWKNIKSISKLRDIK